MINDRINSYVGITDFTDELQVKAMLAVLREIGGSRLIRKLGVGVMMSRKTLNGLPSSFNEVFLAKEKVAGIFLDDLLAYNVLHYADYEGIDVLDNLIEAAKWGGPNMQAIQLDMIWPDPEIIKRFKELHPQIKLIIQINPTALGQVGHQPVKLVETLKAYDSSLGGVLMDMSMGQGVPMSWLNLLPFLVCINDQLPDMGLVVAGGLGPDSLDLVKPLINCFIPEISIDAQGKLRPSGSYLEPIDWQMAEDYLIGAIKIFERRAYKI